LGRVFTHLESTGSKSWQCGQPYQKKFGDLDLAFAIRRLNLRQKGVFLSFLDLRKSASGDERQRHSKYDKQFSGFQHAILQDKYFYGG